MLSKSHFPVNESNPESKLVLKCLSSTIKNDLLIRKWTVVLRKHVNLCRSEGRGIVHIAKHLSKVNFSRTCKYLYSPEYLLIPKTNQTNLFLKSKLKFTQIWAENRGPACWNRRNFRWFKTSHYLLLALWVPFIVIVYTWLLSSNHGIARQRCRKFDNREIFIKVHLIFYKNNEEHDWKLRPL